MISGGAIYIQSGSLTVSLVNSFFHNNSATFCAALGVKEANSSIQIIRSTFTYNRGTGRPETFVRYTDIQLGGVACFNGSNISIFNSDFSHNIASGRAGVLHLEHSNLSVHKSTFDSNRARHNGGVIYAIYSSVAISVNQSSFTYNQAGSDGGGMYIGRLGSHVKLGRATLALMMQLAEVGSLPFLEVT